MHINITRKSDDTQINSKGTIYLEPRVFLTHLSYLMVSNDDKAVELCLDVDELQMLMSAALAEWERLSGIKKPSKVCEDDWEKELS